jgi:hypothetical protein
MVSYYKITLNLTFIKTSEDDERPLTKKELNEYLLENNKYTEIPEEIFSFGVRAFDIKLDSNNKLTFIWEVEDDPYTDEVIHNLNETPLEDTAYEADPERRGPFVIPSSVLKIDPEYPDLGLTLTKRGPYYGELGLIDFRQNKITVEDITKKLKEQESKHTTKNL